jgi:NDP-sugar pyrophosphorylase family protein
MGSIVIYDNARGDTRVKNNIAVRGNFIARYDKQKEDTSLKYVEAGVSIFRKQLLNLIEADRFVSLENDIFPILIKNKELTGYRSKKRFYDIGTFERLSSFKHFEFEP